MWNILFKTLSSAMRDCTFTVLPRRIYVRQKLKVLFLRKKRRWKQWKAHPCKKSKARYASAMRNLTMTMHLYKEREENYVLNRSASGYFRYVESRLRSHGNYITLIGSSVQRSLSEKDICNEFLIEFSKIFSAYLAITTVALKSESCVFQVDVSMPALVSVVCDMPNFEAGPDDIPALVYERCAGSLARPLLSIFQQSLFQRRLPAA